VPGFLQNPAAVNRELKLLFLGCGTDDPRYQAQTRLVALLEKNKIRHEFYATPGEHEWRVWRHLLAEFMPKLFQRVEGL
jgi:enterochelin esterase family protein